MTKEELQEEAKKRAELRQQVYFDDLRWIMGTKQGRRIFFTLLDEAGIFRPGYSNEVSKTYYELGKRDYMLRLHNQITGNYPDLYLLMCKENRVKRLPEVEDDNG